MNFWGGVFRLLTIKTQKPEPYGLFHIFFFIISILAGIFLVKKFRKPTQKQVRSVLLAVSVACIILEIYKQIVYTVSFNGTSFSFKYKWFIFPFQFCSTPMYIGLLAGIIKNERLHKSCCAYLSTYAVFAGLSVMVAPHQVLTNIIGLNIQTMVCHGSMISIGIFLMCSNYIKPDIKCFKRALAVFAVMFSLAVIMNEAAYHAGILKTGEFNMFYISPYVPTIIPILSQIQAVCPTPVPQIAYFAGFTLIAYLILVYFRFLTKQITKHNAEKTAEILCIESEAPQTAAPSNQTTSS